MRLNRIGNGRSKDHRLTCSLESRSMEERIELKENRRRRGGPVFIYDVQSASDLCSASGEDMVRSYGDPREIKRKKKSAKEEKWGV